MIRPVIRWLATIVAALVLCVLSFTTAQAQGVNVLVDNQPLQFDQPPIVQGGRVLVPLRGIFERLGADVVYNAADRSIRATRGSTNVNLTLGSTTAMVDGRTVFLDTPAQSFGGRTVVPLRFISEALGANVTWNAASRTVQIASSGLPPSGSITPPPSGGTPPPPVAQRPTIDQVIHNGLNTLGPGDTLTVIATGTPGSSASFDLLGLQSSINMRETSSGRYEGTFTVPNNILNTSRDVAVVVHLSKNGLEAIQQASRAVTIAANGNNNGGIYGQGINSVTVNPPSAQVGQTITVQVNGANGGYATFDVPSRTGIPMQETSTGNYIGTYTINAQDINGRVIAHLRLPNGNVVSRSSDTIIGQAGYPGTNTGLFVTVTSPLASDTLHDNFTVNGTTIPFATVEVRAQIRRALIPGVFDVPGRSVTVRTQANASGTYSVAVPLDVANNQTVDLQVRAIDQYGNVSQTVQFNVAAGD